MNEFDKDYQEIMNIFKQFCKDQHWVVIYEDPMGIVSIRTKGASWDLSFFAPGEPLSNLWLEKLAGTKQATSWLVLTYNGRSKVESYKLFELSDPTIFEEIIGLVNVNAD